MAAVIKNYQVQLLEEDMEKLREKSGKSNNKDALTAAVYHFLECDGTGGSKNISKHL